MNYLARTSSILFCCTSILMSAGADSGPEHPSNPPKIPRVRFSSHEDVRPLFVNSARRRGITNSLKDGWRAREADDYADIAEGGQRFFPSHEPRIARSTRTHQPLSEAEREVKLEEGAQAAARCAAEDVPVFSPRHREAEPQRPALRKDSSTPPTEQSPKSIGTGVKFFGIGSGCLITGYALYRAKQWYFDLTLKEKDAYNNSFVAFLKSSPLSKTQEKKS